MKIRYIGGPMHGQIEESDDPAPIIVPKGSNFELMMAFLDGKPLLIPCYRLATYEHDENIKAYIWVEPKKS